MHLHRDHPYPGRHASFKGLLELGGASVQITFATADADGERGTRLQLPGVCVAWL